MHVSRANILTTWTSSVTLFNYSAVPAAAACQGPQPVLGWHISHVPLLLACSTGHNLRLFRAYETSSQSGCAARGLVSCPQRQGVLSHRTYKRRAISLSVDILKFILFSSILGTTRYLKDAPLSSFYHTASTLYSPFYTSIGHAPVVSRCNRRGSRSARDGQRLLFIPSKSSALDSTR
jgi:hypothetical protein